MKSNKWLAYDQLDLILPRNYLAYLEEHSDLLKDNPFDRSKWVVGLGDIRFVIGTTLAFREEFPGFPKDRVIIAFLGGSKVEKLEVDKDLFAALDVKTNEVFEVDSFGHARKLADSFESWIESWIVWLPRGPGSST